MEDHLGPMSELIDSWWADTFPSSKTYLSELLKNNASSTKDSPPNSYPILQEAEAVISNNNVEHSDDEDPSSQIALINSNNSIDTVEPSAQDNNADKVGINSSLQLSKEEQSRPSDFSFVSASELKRCDKIQFKFGASFIDTFILHGHGDYSADHLEESNDPVSKEGDFSPCFQEALKDCYQPSELAFTTPELITLFDTDEPLLRCPIQCTEDSFVSSMSFHLIPESLIPYAGGQDSADEDKIEDGTNKVVIIGAETALTTSKALMVQHSSDEKFKRPIKAHHASSYIKSGDHSPTGLTIEVNDLNDMSSTTKCFVAQVDGQHMNIWQEELEMDNT